MRVALQEQGFQDKYDQIVKEFLDKLAADDKRSALENWDAEGTVEIVEDLSKHFRKYIEDEVPDYRTRTQEAHVQDAIRSGSDTAKAGLGAVPGVGELMAIFEGAQSAYVTVDSGIRAVRTRDHETALETAQRNRDQNIEAAIRNMKLDNSAKILNAVALLSDIYTERTRRA